MNGIFSGAPCPSSIRLLVGTHLLMILQSSLVLWSAPDLGGSQALIWLTLFLGVMATSTALFFIIPRPSSTIVSLGLAGNTIGAIRIVKKTTVNYAASNLALSKIEQFAALDPTDLDESMSGVENAVTVPGLGISFQRETTVVSNADDTKTVTVVVKSNSRAVPTKAEFRTTFAHWE